MVSLVFRTFVYLHATCLPPSGQPLKLAHSYIERYQPKNLGRVVMLSPPNQGSEVADWLKDNPLYKSYYGPAGQELGTDRSPSPIGFELGIIAGDRSIDPISSFVIDGKDDGKVAVARTKIQGMKDHITLHTTHAFMMKNNKVIDQILYFIKHGMFEREES